MRALLVLVGILAVAGCSFGEERAEVGTASDPCARPGPWSTWPEADWVREIVRAAEYRVVAETGSALVVSGKRHDFYIWTTDSDGPVGRPWRRMATVRGVPVYGDRNLWRIWQAQGFTFWVQGERAPAAGRLAPVVDASLRIPFREKCRA